MTSSSKSSSTKKDNNILVLTCLQTMASNTTLMWCVVVGLILSSFTMTLVTADSKGLESIPHPNKNDQLSTIHDIDMPSSSHAVRHDVPQQQVLKELFSSSSTKKSVHDVQAGGSSMNAKSVRRLDGASRAYVRECLPSGSLNEGIWEKYDDDGDSYKIKHSSRGLCLAVDDYNDLYMNADCETSSATRFRFENSSMYNTVKDLCVEFDGIYWPKLRTCNPAEAEQSINLVGNKIQRIAGDKSYCLNLFDLLPTDSPTDSSSNVPSSSPTEQRKPSTQSSLLQIQSSMAGPIPETSDTASTMAKAVLQNAIDCNSAAVGGKKVHVLATIGSATASDSDYCNSDTEDRRRLQADDEDTLFIVLTFEQSFDGGANTNTITVIVEMTTDTGGNGMTSSELDEMVSSIDESLSEGQGQTEFVNTMNANENIAITSITGVSSEAIISLPSTYFYIATQSAPKFDWNITLTDPLDIIKPTTDQGIYKMVTEYILDDKHYSVSLYKKDCLNKPTPMNAISLVLEDIDNDIDNANNENRVQLMFWYNQTSVETSDLWTANKTGGYSEFCIKVRNFLEEDGNPLAREIHFLEVKYRIEVDSLTDFNETITVDRIDATDGGTEFINYEEEIEVYQCKDDFSMITSPPDLTQGDFLQICVTTKGDSKFGVHSVKELDVSQKDDTPSLYPYVDGFIDSPLAESLCKEDVKNTSAAVCKTKMQLLSAYFDSTDPEALFANGTVKLDYVGRRLSIDVPVSLRYDGDGAVTEEAAEAGRVLAEGDEGPSFGIEVGLSGGDGSASDASLSLLSMGGLFSAGMAFLVAGMV